jgi:hypothetical protein
MRYGLQLVAAATALPLACAPKPVGVGSTRAEVVEALGKPNVWLTMAETAYGPGYAYTMILEYNEQTLLNRPMPADQRWVWEYADSAGAKYCLFLVRGSVVRRVAGPAMVNAMSPPL